MAADSGQETPAVDPGAVLGRYQRWLARQPLADRSREAYLAQVASFVAWLANSEAGSDALTVGQVRDWAVRDYKRYLKQRKRQSPASVNQALAAIDNFYRSIDMGTARVDRERLVQAAPRALGEDEQRSLLRAVERCPSPRDRAIVTLLLYTSVRLSELAALEVTDVSVSARKGMLTVRSGKGDAFREVPLNSACREAVQEWLIDRPQKVSTTSVNESGLWLSKLGRAMTPRAVDHVIRKVAAEANLEGVSAHVLRHSFVTNLVRSGTDVVLVAELAGHRRLDTTRLYSLPTRADQAAAVESVVIEP